VNVREEGKIALGYPLGLEVRVIVWVRVTVSIRGSGVARG